MTDKDEILAAIAGLGSKIETLDAKIDANHAQVMGHIDALAASSDRGLARVENAIDGLRNEMLVVLKNHDTRIAALEGQQ